LFDRLANKGIAEIKALPDKCRQSAELKDAWADFPHPCLRCSAGDGCLSGRRRIIRAVSAPLVFSPAVAS
jgi:hypothetical protein